MSALVKAFPVKQVLPLMSKYKQNEVTRLLRALGIKRRISYATWVEVDEQQAHRAGIFTVHQRVGNPVIELPEKSTRFPCLLIWSLDFYWFNDCLRVLRILSAIFIARSERCRKISKKEISFSSLPKRLNLFVRWSVIALWIRYTRSEQIKRELRSRKENYGV